MADVRSGPFVVEIPMKNLWPANKIYTGGSEECKRNEENRGMGPAGVEPEAIKIAESDDAPERMCMASRSNGTP
jgi:hypothetical protein